MLDGLKCFDAMIQCASLEATLPHRKDEKSKSMIWTLMTSKIKRFRIATSGGDRTTAQRKFQYPQTLKAGATMTPALFLPLTKPHRTEYFESLEPVKPRVVNHAASRQDDRSWWRRVEREHCRSRL